MIALLLALHATGPIQIKGARRSTAADRVFAQGILFRCDVSLDGLPLAWQAQLEGEITGTGKGPLLLVANQSVPATKFRSYRGMVSYDEKLPYGKRPLFVSLNARQGISGKSYVGELRFTYNQDGTAPNQVNRAKQVADAKIAFYRSRDIISSNGLHYPKEGALAVGTAACLASDRNTQ